MKKTFVKRTEDEQFLQSINCALKDLEKELLNHSAYEKRAFPTVHVLGVPRSGTTLLIQQMASTLGIGYVNNLIAAFWEAPMCGIRLSQKLLNDKFASDYSSTYGRTQRIEEPHEFGYFWAHHLRLASLAEPHNEEKERIDWDVLNRTLEGMGRAFDKPVVLKSFQLGWFLEEFSTRVPNSLFIYVRRDLLSSALSLLRMRQEVYGSKERWTSLRPREYEQLSEQPYWVQVAGQVYFLDSRFRANLARVPVDRCLELELSELQREPDGVMRRIAEFLGAKGWEPRDIKAIETARVEIGRRLRGGRDYELVKSALEDFRSGRFDHLSVCS